MDPPFSGILALLFIEVLLSCSFEFMIRKHSLYFCYIDNIDIYLRNNVFKKLEMYEIIQNLPWILLMIEKITAPCLSGTFYL